MDSNLKDQLNFYFEFKDWYYQIIKDFQFDLKKDYKARDYLSLIFMKKGQNWKLENILSSFKDKVKSKPVFLVYGCGPSLEYTVNVIKEQKGIKFFDKFINLAADGAAVLLREKGIKVDAIFTDLDGITKKEFNYSHFNIIHAHGDNIERLKFFENEIISFKNIIGTTQVEPMSNVINTGGFTDGDRILYFLRPLLLSFQKVFLIGMDFGNITGKYSKLDFKKNLEANPIKQKKLIYAIKLIKWLKNKVQYKIFFVNSEFNSEDFVNLTIDEFLNFIILNS